ncbi:hypothetical protein ABNF97_09460 [Plantactinospora sp. B6F1]
MSKVRWNFRLGPLQFTSPVTLSAVLIFFAVVGIFCCCGVLNPPE